jgi:hypothetical protein
LTGLDGTVTTGKVTKVQSPGKRFPFLSELLGGRGVKLSVMRDEKVQEPEEEKPVEPAIDWAGLRAQADKLGITLSQLQQLQFEKKMRLARKARPGAPPGKDGPLGKVERS